MCVFVCVRVSFFFGVCCKKNRLSKAKSKALAAFQHASREHSSLVAVTCFRKCLVRDRGPPPVSLSSSLLRYN